MFLQNIGSALQRLLRDEFEVELGVVGLVGEVQLVRVGDSNRCQLLVESVPVPALVGQIHFGVQVQTALVVQQVEARYHPLVPINVFIFYPLLVKCVFQSAHFGLKLLSHLLFYL